MTFRRGLRETLCVSARSRSVPSPESLCEIYLTDCCEYYLDHAYIIVPGRNYVLAKTNKGPGLLLKGRVGF